MEQVVLEMGEIWPKKKGELECHGGCDSVTFTHREQNCFS